jgi:hypothetical protein
MTGLAFGAAGAEGIGLGPGVNDTEIIGGTGSDPDGAGTEGIGVVRGGDKGGWLNGGN